MKVGRGLTLLLLLTASTCADDEAIPVYDIKGFCLHQTSLAMPNILVAEHLRMIEACYRKQARAYELLRTLWPKVPTAIRAQYDAAARSQRFSQGFGDYEFLQDRLSVEMQRSHGAFHKEDIEPRK